MKKMLGLLCTIGLSIAPMMSVVACTTSELFPDTPIFERSINSADLKIAIDNQGQGIYINPVMDESGNQDLQATETEFTDWFSDQIENIVGLTPGSVAVDQDYTVSFSHNGTYEGDFSSSFLRVTDVVNRLTTKKLIITPTPNSKYLTGSPISFYTIISDRWTYSSLCWDQSISDEEGKSSDFPIDWIHGYDEDNYAKIDISTMNSDKDVQNFILDTLFTHNLVGFDRDINDSVFQLIGSQTNEPFDWNNKNYSIEQNIFFLFELNPDFNTYPMNQYWWSYSELLWGSSSHLFFSCN